MALFESSLVTVMGDVEPDSISNCEVGPLVPFVLVSVPLVTFSSDEKTDDCPVLLELTVQICDCCCCCCAAARMPDSEFCCGFVPTVGGGPFLLEEPPNALTSTVARSDALPFCTR